MSISDYRPTNVEDPFKNNQGFPLQRGLFFETSPFDAKREPTYTLKDKDHTFEGKTYLSLKRLYLEEEDLTEYFFATKYLSNWTQWDNLTKSKWFKEYIDLWRTELELKLKAKAMRNIIDEAVSGGKNGYNANKFIVEKGWVDKTTEPSRRGRPTKAEISRKAAEQLFEDQQLKDDLKRLGLN